MMRLYAAVLIMGAWLPVCGQAVPNASAPTLPREYRNLIIAAIQDIDMMHGSDGELEWQLDRIEAHRSATALIRAAENEAQFHLAGYVWDMYENAVTCRIEAAASESGDRCHTTAMQLRTEVLADAGIDPRRLYPHSR